MTPALQQAMAYMNENRELTQDEVGRIIREVQDAVHQMRTTDTDAGTSNNRGPFFDVPPSEQGKPSSEGGVIDRRELGNRRPDMR